MSKKNKEKFRGRLMRLLLYEEDPSHKAALEKLKDYEAAYILHDKDLANDDDCKKPHYHVVLRFTNAKWNTALAKELGITPNYTRPCDNLNKSLGYLIHFFQSDKYQYDYEEVKGDKSLLNILWSIIIKANKTQEEISDDIVDFIENAGPLTTVDFVRWINANGYFSNLKSGSGWYRDILREHNDKIRKRQANSYGSIKVLRQGVELSKEEIAELFE